MSTDTYDIAVPQGVEVKIEKDILRVKGPKGEVARPFPHKSVEVKAESNKVIISPKDKSSQTKTLVGTFNSHIKNMIAGVQNPYVYKLKVAFTHFPITVSSSASEFSVQNFLGEKKPRKVRLPQGVKVSVQGDRITVESADIELAGKVATLLEHSTKVSNKDRRIFQDGIYLVEKGK